jgi:4-amino-4-deoxy-L-arabinose transferase-like glycosyltransferase
VNSLPNPSLNKSGLRWLVIIAALSYAPALAFYYVGEEAIFPISALEMWSGGDWIRQHLYGANLQHNPFYNWLIIPLASLAGWQYMLPVARAITIAATLATAAILGWLTLRLLRDEALAWFAALIYLTLADVALYRGWLAYVDPLFGMFVFGAIAALWVACAEERPVLLVLAVASLTCAFMSKAFTAYVFYATAAFVLLFTQSARRVLRGRVSIVLHVLALLAPFAWLYSVPVNAGQSDRMLSEIVAKLMPAGPLQYLQHLIGFPTESILRMAPALPLAAFFAWRRRISLKAEPVLAVAASIALLCYLPYWLAPLGAIRYLLPLYPMVALAVAIVLWRAGEPALALSRRWLAGMLVFKLIAVVILFPYYQSHYRGENYALAARDIIVRTAGHPLYVTDVSASGLSVAGYIDAYAHPAPPLMRPPAQWDSGFVIAYEEDAQTGRTFKHYPLAGNNLYLLCRGAACAAGR